MKNMPQEWDEEKIKEIAGEFGSTLSISGNFYGFFIISDFVFTVQAASNVQDESGTSKKFGFVSFERHEDAEKCVNELNGKS